MLPYRQLIRVYTAGMRIHTFRYGRTAGWFAGPVLETLFVGLSAILAIGMLAIIMLQLLNDREDVGNEAVKIEDNISLILSAYVEQRLGLLETLLKGVRESLPVEGPTQPTPITEDRISQLQSAMEDTLSAVVILDHQGIIRASSHKNRLVGTDLSSREYFKYHQNNSGMGLFLSGPINTVKTKEPALIFSLRVEDARGEFVGVISAALRLSYFDTLFSRLNLPKHSSITLLLNKGIALARRPTVPNLAGTDLSNSPALIKSEQQGEQVFEAVAQLDQINKLYVSRKISHYPLRINVAWSVEEVYREWTVKAIIIGIVTTLFSAGIITLLIVQYRMNGWLRGTHEALNQANRELQLQAGTDGLTGIANRRRLDEYLNSIPPGRKTALLLLDVDHFKYFNDRYGHLAGDTALREVAHCIAGAVRGAQDIVARYGGEEFAVVLAQLSPEAALQVAQRIRDDVQALAIPHQDSPHEVVTISIGLAWMDENHMASTGGLIATADEALYLAKTQGRNRVVLADKPCLDAQKITPPFQQAAS